MFNKPQNCFLGLGLATALLTTANTAQAAIIQLTATLNQEQEVINLIQPNKNLNNLLIIIGRSVVLEKSLDI